MKKALAIASALVVLMLLSLDVSGATSADTPGHPERIDLKLNLKAGQTFRMLTTIEQETVQSVQGQEMKVLSTLRLGETFAVREVDAQGTAIIDVTLGPVSYKTQTPEGMGGSLDYDSTTSGNNVPVQARGLAALVGKSFAIKLSDRGAVAGVAGVDKMFDEIRKSLDVPDEQTKEQLIKDLELQYDANGLKEMVENLMAFLPDRPVAIGDTWKRAAGISHCFPSTGEATYRLVSGGNGVAVVGMAATMKPDPNAEPMTMGPVTMKYELEGTQKAACRLDEETGWALKAKAIQDLKGTLHMSGAPGQSGDTAIRVHIKRTVTSEAK